jgi:hypothetical protein
MTVSATQQVSLDDLAYQYYDHRSTRLAREFLGLVPTRSKKLSDLGPQFFQDFQISASFDALIRFYELVCVGMVLGYLPPRPGSSFVKTTLGDVQHGLIHKYCRERRDSAAVSILPTLLKDRSPLIRAEIGVEQSGTKAMVELVGLVSRLRDDEDFQNLKLVLRNSEGNGNTANDLLDALSSPASCISSLLGSSSHSGLLCSGLRGLFNFMQFLSDLYRLFITTAESARTWLTVPFGADLTPEIFSVAGESIAVVNRWRQTTNTEVDDDALSSLEVWNEALQYVSSEIAESKRRLRKLLPDRLQPQAPISAKREMPERLDEAFTLLGRSGLSETVLKDLVLSRLTREFGSNIRVDVPLRMPGSRDARVDAVIEQKGVTTFVEFKTHRGRRTGRLTSERRLSDLRRYAEILPEADRGSIRFVVVELLSGIQEHDTDQLEAERNAFRAQFPFPVELRSYRLSDLQDELSLQWRSLQDQ